MSAASGFIGGPIFPVLFIGGTSGVIVNQVFPDVPLGLAFTCLLAAVPGAIVSAPFSLVLLAALLTQVGTLQTAPILIAVGTASLIAAGCARYWRRAAAVHPPRDPPHPDGKAPMEQPGVQSAPKTAGGSHAPNEVRRSGNVPRRSR